MLIKRLWPVALLLVPVTTESAKPVALSAPNNFIHTQIDSAYEKIYQQLDSINDRLDAAIRMHDGKEGRKLSEKK